VKEQEQVVDLVIAQVRISMFPRILGEDAEGILQAED